MGFLTLHFLALCALCGVAEATTPGSVRGVTRRVTTRNSGTGPVGRQSRRHGTSRRSTGNGRRTVSPREIQTSDKGYSSTIRIEDGDIEDFTNAVNVVGFFDVLNEYGQKSNELYMRIKRHWPDQSQIGEPVLNEMSSGYVEKLRNMRQTFIKQENKKNGVTLEVEEETDGTPGKKEGKVEVHISEKEVVQTLYISFAKQILESCSQMLSSKGYFLAQQRDHVPEEEKGPTVANIFQLTQARLLAISRLYAKKNMALQNQLRTFKLYISYPKNVADQPSELIV